MNTGWFRRWMSGLSGLARLSFLSPRYALLTNTVTGAGLFVLGDLVQQRIEIHQKLHPHVDTDRVKRIGVIGLVEAPPHYYFYRWLDRYVPGRSTGSILKKILLDQLIACPSFSFQFFFGMALLEGKTTKDAWNEFCNKFPTVYLVDWLLWPPCQALNFFLVPAPYRVLYVNTVTVAWNVFLSYFKHYDQLAPPHPPSSPSQSHPPTKPIIS